MRHNMTFRAVNYPDSDLLPVAIADPATHVRADPLDIPCV